MQSAVLYSGPLFFRHCLFSHGTNQIWDKWQEIWDALYWRFIDKHREVFNKNIRMKFMVSMYDKMLTEKKEKYIIIADNYFKSLDVELN